jgi:hypothetical protein
MPPKFKDKPKVETTMLRGIVFGKSRTDQNDSWVDCQKTRSRGEDKEGGI